MRKNEGAFRGALSLLFPPGSAAILAALPEPQPAKNPRNNRQHPSREGMGKDKIKAAWAETCAALCLSRVRG